MERRDQVARRLRLRRTVRVLGAGALGVAMSAVIGSGVTGASNGHARTHKKSETVVSASMKYEIAHAGQLNTAAFCGHTQIKLGILDGFGVNAWSQASMAAVRSEAAKCKNVKQVVQIAEGTLDRAISQIESMTAQGVNALVVIPDFGQSELPAIRAATRAGVKVVPWGANPGGKSGKTFVSYVDWVPGYSGTLFANWLVQVLHGHGDIVELGGPAGNPVSEGILDAVDKVFAKHPGMKLLTGTSKWPATTWTPAKAQQIGSSLLSEFPTINGIISTYGTDALSVLHAFQAAGRSIPAVAAATANGLGCLWKSTHAKDPHFQLSTVSTRNWLGRVAARKAIAAAEGIKDTEPSLYNLTFYENTLSGPPHCTSHQPTDRYLSDDLSPAVLAKYGKT
ncbi:MAG: substrate-binding domain-containing protein [Acidimicrobiales bacterium]